MATPPLPPAGLRPDPLFSPSSSSSTDHASLNTMRLALTAMKERCQRQQRRIDELEMDNEEVRSSRTDLYR